MLVEPWRPALQCEGYPCDNLSPNKKVLFIDEDHKYFYHTDVVDKKTLTPFNKSVFKFRSPTGMIAQFKEHFDTELQAKKYVKKHKLDITWEEQAFLWSEKGRIASEEGTILHGYAEAKWNKWDMPKPEQFKKADMVDTMYAELSKTFKLARTELLVYSNRLRLAGQVDLLLKSDDGEKYSLMDYKFIKKPLEKKSFFNWGTKKYKMMSGPFRKLMDCNYNHYSIQMELYRMLMGSLGKKVVAKILIVFTPEDGIMYEDGLEMTIWVDANMILHAKYKDSFGKAYDSSKDPVYLKNRYRL